MITPAGLEDALVDFLQNNVANKILLKSFDVRNKVQTIKNPQVIKGYIIPKLSSQNSDDGSEFPYICTRLLELKDDNPKLSQFTVKVKIMFGTYCLGSFKDEELIEDGSGYRDIWNMIEKTRQVLFQNKIIDNKYLLLDSPFIAELPEDQPYPYWEGWIICYFNVGMPVVEGFNF